MKISSFSSKSLMFLTSVFRSLLHFELIFVCGVDRVPTSFFYMFYIQVFHQYLLEKTVLLPLNDLDTVVENQLTIYMQGFISGFFTSLVYMFVLFLVPHCFDYFSSAVNFEIRKYEFSSFFFLIILAIQDFLRFFINFRMDFPISAKNAVEILMEISLNL